VHYGVENEASFHLGTRTQQEAIQRNGWHQTACRRRLSVYLGLCLCVCPVWDNASGIWGFRECLYCYIVFRAIPSFPGAHDFTQCWLSMVMLDGKPQTSDIIVRGFRTDLNGSSYGRSLTGTFSMHLSWDKLILMLKDRRFLYVWYRHHFWTCCLVKTTPCKAESRM